MKEIRTLTLYTRNGCHLCDDMERALTVLQQQYNFSLNVVDIDRDSYLQFRYDERVPVLADGETEICHYHLNEDMVRAHLKSL